MHFKSSETRFDLHTAPFDTSLHLANARRQADTRGFDEILIVDADCHHYETDNLEPIIGMIEDPALRQVAQNTYKYKGASAVLYDQPGFQDVGGRITRYMERRDEGSRLGMTGAERDSKQAQKWMDALSVDYACMFPTPMLTLAYTLRWRWR